jgi:3-deoxy-7-phosphoheptulonate synthase
MLASKGLNQAIVVDCSHANSRKKTDLQAVVWRDVINQRVDGNDAIVGLMLESHLFEGTQKLTGDPSTLQYGVSLTDPCISWETTEELLLSADAFLKPLLKAGTKIPPSASSRYRSA